MTQGTKGAPKPRTTSKPLKKTDLPIRVPLIHGETTASYLARTAAANGIEAGRLLKALHQGRLPGGTFAPVHPNLQETRLSQKAVTRLAELVERDEDQLRRALPGLRPEKLLGTAGAEVRISLWPEAAGEGPLKACPLCLEDGAWLVADGHRWRPCTCGRRWQCGDDNGYLIDTTPLPEIGAALRDHRALDHKLGPAGDALVADAHQITLWWWTSRQVAHDQWRERENTLGFPKHRRRAAPAVVYPEALLLADALNTWETLRATDPKASAREWRAEVADRFKTPGIVDGRESAPLTYWLELHGQQTDQEMPRGRMTPESRWNQLPDLHHRPAEAGPMRSTSCLRWVHGLPLTSVTELCPHCAGRAPSCRWVASPDCPQRPSKDQHP
ncbi:TniQ family protein [Streptomyces sp. NPDC006339]|uniref:TniQ family protein n=1 Tax=Streptomyces sp. NPDC006339 TaxID=3156755 RepID=UPI0033AFC1A9